MKTAILFGGAFIVILFSYVAAHAAIYFLLVRFFAISSSQIKTILISLVSFLAISFFLATFLAHLRENEYTIGYYFFAGTWLGLLVNLLLAFALVLVISKLVPIFALPSREKILAVIAIFAAILYSAYGVWNAFDPRVTKVGVTLANLPEQWRGKKIVQVSDVHLGHIYSDSYMSKIADKIAALHPDVIVITGDLFDGTDGSLQKFVAPLNKLAAPQGVYFISGNHEIYLGEKNAYKVISQTGIRHLHDELKNLDGLQLIGIDYPQQGHSKNIGEVIRALSDFNPKQPSILLWHVPSQTQAAKDAGISLQLSGHTHKGQIFPFGFISYLTYQGYDYGLKSNGNFQIYTSSGLGGWGPPMRTEKTSEIVEITLK